MLIGDIKAHRNLEGEYPVEVGGGNKIEGVEKEEFPFLGSKIIIELTADTTYTVTSITPPVTKTA